MDYKQLISSLLISMICIVIIIVTFNGIGTSLLLSLSETFIDDNTTPEGTGLNILGRGLLIVFMIVFIPIGLMLIEQGVRALLNRRYSKFKPYQDTRGLLTSMTNGSGEYRFKGIQELSEEYGEGINNEDLVTLDFLEVEFLHEIALLKEVSSHSKILTTSEKRALQEEVNTDIKMKLDKLRNNKLSKLHAEVAIYKQLKEDDVHLTNLTKEL